MGVGGRGNRDGVSMEQGCLVNQVVAQSSGDISQQVTGEGGLSGIGKEPKRELSVAEEARGI